MAHEKNWLIVFPDNSRTRINPLDLKVKRIFLFGNMAMRWDKLFLEFSFLLSYGSFRIG